MKKYIEYLKNNPKGYWFKRKVYGWGWTPATWQGFLITFLYIGMTLFLALTVDENSPTREVMFIFIIPFTLATTTYLRILYLKGEKPKWMWGIPKDES